MSMRGVRTLAIVLICILSASCATTADELCEHMGKRVSGRVPTDDDRLPVSFRSHEILGVRVESELLLEFAEATDTTPPMLSLTSVGR